MKSTVSGVFEDFNPIAIRGLLFFIFEIYTEPHQPRCSAYFSKNENNKQIAARTKCAIQVVTVDLIAFKGQLISKGLFGILNSSKYKLTKNLT